MTIRVDQTNSTQQTQTTQSTGPVQHSSVRESLAKRVIGITEKLMYRGQKAVRTVKRNGNSEFLSNVSGLIDCVKNSKVKEAGSDSFDLCAGRLKAQLNVKIGNAIIGPGPLGNSESSFLEKKGSLDGLIDLKHDCDKAAKQLLKAYKETGDQRLLVLYGGVKGVGNSAKEAIEKFNQVKLQNTWFFHKETDGKGNDYTEKLQKKLNDILISLPDVSNGISSDMKKCSPEAQNNVLDSVFDLAKKDKEMKKTVGYLSYELKEGMYDKIAEGLKTITGIDLTTLLSEYENNIHSTNASIRYDLLDEASVEKLKSSGTYYIHTIQNDDHSVNCYIISDQPGKGPEDTRVRGPLTEIDKEEILAKREEALYVQDFEEKLESLTAGKLTSEQLEALQELKKNIETSSERLNMSHTGRNTSSDYYGLLVGRNKSEAVSRTQMPLKEVIKGLEELKNLDPNATDYAKQKGKCERLSYRGLNEIIKCIFEARRQSNLGKAFIEIEPSNVDSEEHQVWERRGAGLSADNYLPYLKGKFEAKGEDFEMFMKVRPSKVDSADYKAWAKALKDVDPQKYIDYLEAKRA